MSVNRLEDEQALRDEARFFTRYLLDKSPTEELVDRYVAASRVHFSNSAAPSDVLLLNFAHRHPWAIPLLDGAVALFRPQALLRNKILLMTAILEASPRFAGDFLSERSPVRTLLLRLITCGVVVPLKVLAGSLLLALIGRKTR